MKTWKVWSCDVWGNAEDGWEVNDLRPLDVIRTSDDPTDGEIWSELVVAGIARGPLKWAKFDWPDDTFLSVLDVLDGERPVFQLELVGEG